MSSMPINKYIRKILYYALKDVIVSRSYNNSNKRLYFAAYSYNADGSSDPQGHVVLEALSGQLSTNRWYMLTITHDSASHTWKFYVNGNLESSVTKPSGIGPGALTRKCPYAIGGRPVNTSWGMPFAGRIDELKFWSRVLTPGEIANIYTAQQTSQGSPNIDFPQFSIGSLFNDFWKVLSPMVSVFTNSSLYP